MSRSQYVAYNHINCPLLSSFKEYIPQQFVSLDRNSSRYQIFNNKKLHWEAYMCRHQHIDPLAQDCNNSTTKALESL